MIVAGAGVTGLATALAVATGRGPRPRVLIFDPGLGEDPPRTLRAVAISPASRRFLDRLGVWAAVAPAAQPIWRMVLGDTRPGAVPAPDYLRFEADGKGGEPLAHMVLQDDLGAALRDGCQAAGVVLRAERITGFAATVGGLRLSGGKGESRLLVAADGGRSRLRDAAGIRTVGRDYGQAGIVATLAHSIDHGGEALQVFLPEGPLAVLPLRAPDGSGHRSSIVWTAGVAEASRLTGLPPQAFCAEVLACGGQARGALTLEDTPRAYPLAVRLARHLIAPRLALVGDAARTIHPLAGQGLNLGLQDAEALGRHVAEALGLGLDPGSTPVLEAYQRDRRISQVAMAAATDGLNRLFSNDSAPLRLLRDVGLGLVDRAPGLKAALIRRASGLG